MIASKDIVAFVGDDRFNMVKNPNTKRWDFVYDDGARQVVEDTGYRTIGDRPVEWWLQAGREFVQRHE